MQTHLVGGADREGKKKEKDKKRKGEKVETCGVAFTAIVVYPTGRTTLPSRVNR